VNKRILLTVGLTLAFLAADQVTKIWARASLRCASIDRAKATGSACGPCTADRTCDEGYHCRRLDGAIGCAKVLVLINGYLEFEYFENPGSAFGLLRNVPGSRYILIAVGIIALVVVWRMTRKVTQRQRMADLAFALVAGGAIGNLWDRVYIGRVVDFIVMHFHHKYTWFPYNIADAELVFGVGLMVLVLGRKQEEAAAPSSRRGKGKGKGKAKAKGKKR
jgi:signal peptidase II